MRFLLVLSLLLAQAGSFGTDKPDLSRSDQSLCGELILKMQRRRANRPRWIRTYLLANARATLKAAGKTRQQLRGYDRLYIELSESSQTLHRSDDGYYVLELPKSGKPTIYKFLTEDERRTLVEILRDTFADAAYDSDLVDDGGENIFAELIGNLPEDDAGTGTLVTDGEYPEEFEKLWASLPPSEPRDLNLSLLTDMMMRGATEEEIDREIYVSARASNLNRLGRYSWKEGESRGISPRLVLLAAKQGRKIGICRDTAKAMLGLLFELGYPRQNWRLINGQTGIPGELGHQWVEGRFQSDGNWTAYDPTARFTRRTAGIGGIRLLAILSDTYSNPLEKLHRDFPIRDDFTDGFLRTVTKP